MRSPASIPSRRGPAGAGRSRGRARWQVACRRRSGSRCGLRPACAARRSRRLSRRWGRTSRWWSAYGLILPRRCSPGRRGAGQHHASLLPRWRGRGADPAGDHGRGRRDRGVDHGDGGGARHRAGAAGGGGADRGARHRGQLRRAAGGARGAARRRGAGRARPASAGAAAGGGRDLCREDRQGRGAVDWGRPAAAVDRLSAGSRHFRGLVRDRRRAGEAAAERAGRRGGAPGEVLDERLAVACGEGGGAASLAAAGRGRRGRGGRLPARAGGGVGRRHG